MAKIFSKLKSIDFYKKLPSDLVEATLAGAWLSIAASFIMIFLLIAEFSSFISVATREQLIVDRSPSDELLKVNFNISFPSLSCEFASLDISDALGTKRINLTKTLRKVPITADLQRAGAATEDSSQRAQVGPKYDNDTLQAGMDPDYHPIDISVPLSHDNFEATLEKYPIVLINFYAPWCHWCQRLEPSWEAATREVHEKYPEREDGRIRYAKVDCTAESNLCRSHFIQGFPSIRVFRKGHDEILTQGFRDHEAYTGDRTKEALVAFADSLVPSAGLPHHRHVHLSAAPRSSGCNLAGYAMVKKVPGTLHFTARGSGFSFDHDGMNLTHVVHGFHLGSRPSPRKLTQLQRLHPAGLSTDWADKLRNKIFASDDKQTTHEHYLQVVLTTIQARDGSRGGSYDAYEYTARSHAYQSDSIPSAKFTMDPSPIQILVSELRRPWYKFLTTTCAVIGGVFTVAGILDSIVYSSIKVLKKTQLGKQG